jgi:hypothetical protein
MRFRRQKEKIMFSPKLITLTPKQANKLVTDRTNRRQEKATDFLRRSGCRTMHEQPPNDAQNEK